MNEIVRFPPQLRVVDDGVPPEMDRLTPRYAAFCRSMRRARQDWFVLVESGELTNEELAEEARAQGGTLPQILEALRSGSTTQPDQTPLRGA